MQDLAESVFVPVVKGGSIAAAVWLLGILVGAGCSSDMPRPQAVPFPSPPPAPSGISLATGAWIAPVEFADPAWQDQERSDLSRAFTVEIGQYVRQADYFARVNTLPGQPGPRDYLLRFRIDRYTKLHWFRVWWPESGIRGEAPTGSFEVDVHLEVEDASGTSLFAMMRSSRAPSRPSRTAQAAERLGRTRGTRSSARFDRAVRVLPP